MHVASVDILLIVIYCGFVLAIGFLLRRQMVGSTEFFLAGRSMPAWVAGLAFLSANLGAQEMIGMAASGAKYGILTSHFYWLGAIPAMAFVGVFMMPFYYGSQARSVPEYLKLRFDEKTRGFNAVTFAVMTVFSSGISMYAMGALLALLLGWNIHASIALSAVVVLFYIALGGLTSAIYNEVLQFFLIVFGFLPVAYLGLRDAGGWSGLAARVPDTFVHSWTYLGRADANPMGVEWFGMVMGAWLRSVVRVLVHRLSCRAACDGRRFDERGAPDASHRRHAEDAVPVPRDRAGHRGVGSDAAAERRRGSAAAEAR